MITAPTPSEDELHDAPAILAEDAVLFPGMEVTMAIRDSKNVAATAQASKEHSLVVLIPTLGPDGAVGSIGTLVFLQRMTPVRGGGVQWVSKGLWRVRVERVLEEKTYVRVRFRKVGDIEDIPSGNRSDMMKAVHDQIDEFVRLMPGIPPEIIAFLKELDTPGKLADMCANSPFFTHDERLDLLKTLDAEKRLEKVNKLFTKQLNDLRGLAKKKTILECTTCIDLADRAFELGPRQSGDVAREFLDHVIRDHRDELLTLLAEKYGPAFLSRRELK